MRIRVQDRAGAWVGGLLLMAAALAALGAPSLASFPPNEINLAVQLQPPSRIHPAGTDFYGRDIASRLLFGARTTLGITVLAVGLSLVAGTLLGLVAGYSRGWLGQAWVGLIDLLLAFPTLLLALLVVALLGAGLGTVAIAVGIAGIAGYARIVRSVVLTTRSASYIEAARAIGASGPRILRRHLLPGVAAPVLALVTVDAGRAILFVSALGFLGLGAAPPRAEWGLMLYENRQYLSSAPWASVGPGLAITLTVLGATLLGDALDTN
jgi:peptide/nickel transport system permease protein